MIGQMARAGATFGHSGAGPGSVSAVYHFSDPLTRTVAAFAEADSEGAIEYQVARLACS
jgi:hypothetical protein